MERKGKTEKNRTRTMSLDGGLKEKNESKLTWKSKPKFPNRGGWRLNIWHMEGWATVEKNSQRDHELEQRKSSHFGI